MESDQNRPWEVVKGPLQPLSISLLALFPELLQLLLAAFVVLFWSHCYLSLFVNFHKPIPTISAVLNSSSCRFFVHLISLPFPCIPYGQAVCACWETCIVLLRTCNIVMTVSKRARLMHYKHLLSLYRGHVGDKHCPLKKWTFRKSNFSQVTYPVQGTALI